MAASIGVIRDRIKRELEQWLPGRQIEQEAKRCGHRWRKRKLGPAQTIHLLLAQLLAWNTALTAVRHLAAAAVTAGALCQARTRLPLMLLRRCCELVSANVAQQAQRFDWCGREVLAADGVCYYTPDTPPLRKWLGSKNRFGFPLMKVVTLFNLSSGVMQHQIPLPHRRGEAPLLGRLLRLATPAAVIVMDRAFASFANLHAVLQWPGDAVIRLNSRLLAKKNSLRRVIKRLGKNDLLVCWAHPENRCSLLSRLRWNALPAELTLRQVSFIVARRGCRSRRISIITTLLDPAKYPAQKLAELYQRRWEIELQFRHVKQTLNWEFLRCKTCEGVKKELLLRQIAFNVLRAIIAAQADAQETTIDRISFVDTLRWLIYSPTQPTPMRPTPMRPTPMRPTPMQPTPMQPTPVRLMQSPHRPGRSEPRRLKRQDKNYLPLNCSRAEARRKAA